MKTGEEEKKLHLGKNVKCLMRAFGLQQYELANKAGLSDNQLSTLMHKADIDDDTLEKLAKGLGNGVTPDLIKAYRHEDTLDFIINNYTQNIQDGGIGNQNQNSNTQNVENGGTGTLIPEQDNSATQTIENGGTGTQTPTTFQEGSTQNNYVAEQAFELAEKNVRLEKLLLYYRMQIEPDAVREEMESLKKNSTADEG